jgi:hypothetical protein
MIPSEKPNKTIIMFLLRENLPQEIPASLLMNENCFFIHEAPSFSGKTLPAGRSASFETLMGLDGMMDSVWNQIEWLKRWSDIPLMDGKSFKQLYEHRGLPLWYFAELSMHYPKHLLRIITILDVFHLVCSDYKPAEIKVINPDLPYSDIILKAAAVKNIPADAVKGGGSYTAKQRRKEFMRLLSPGILARFYIIKQLASVFFIYALKPLMRNKMKRYIYNGKLEPPADMKKICIVSHGSYWRKAPSYYTGQSRELDMYWDRLIDELNSETGAKNSAVTVLGAGPRTIHKRRRFFIKFREFFLPLGEDLPYAPVKCFSTFGTWRRTCEATRRILKRKKEFLNCPDLFDSIVYRGVNFFDEFYPDLKEMFVLMLPWGIKVIEQSLSALEQLKPDVVCLYAEAGGYGRAVAYTAKLLEIKTLAIQHGLIFPHNYTYVHTQEEIQGKAGAPYPFTDRFLLYDSFVKKILEKHGSYPSKTLEVTGGHKMDNLLAIKKTTDPRQKKKELGYDDRDRFAVIASRFSEIGSAFPHIVKAIEEIPRLHLIVKPHQAELPEYYEEIAQKLGAKKVKVVSNKENLFDLMLSGDLLITVNSLAALEAILLEKPVMVVNLPNHLSVYVDAGIAVGVKTHQEILPVLKKLFIESQQDLLKRQAEFSRENAFKTDGLSGERIKAEIYALCRPNPKAKDTPQT